MKKLIGKLHLWLGLASGVVVFVVSVTGCLYVFLDDLESVLHRRERFVQVRPEAKLARPSEVFASIRRTFPARAFENVYYTDYAEEGRVHSVWAYDGEEEAYEAVWVHPETAEVTRTYTYAAGFSEDFAGTLIELHTSLMLGDVGREIVGVSTLVFVVMMFSGLVLWWPRTWRALKPRLTLKLSGGQKRVNYDLHNVLGFYVGWVLLIIALTGLVWAYEWVSHAVQWTVNGGVVTHTEPAELKVSEVSSDRALTAVDAAYGELLETLPPQHHFVLSEPKTAEPIAITAYPTPRNMPWTRHTFDPESGTRLAVLSSTQLSRGEQLRDLNWDIHVGTLWGWPTKILAFAASFISASLPITGFLIWFPRWRKRRRA